MMCLWHISLTGQEPLLPEKWGWTTAMINLNTPDFERGLLNRLILREIKAQIRERRRNLHHETNANGDETPLSGY